MSASEIVDSVSEIVDSLQDVIIEFMYVLKARQQISTPGVRSNDEENSQDYTECFDHGFNLLNFEQLQTFIMPLNMRFPPNNLGNFDDDNDDNDDNDTDDTDDTGDLTLYSQIILSIEPEGLPEFSTNQDKVANFTSQCSLLESDSGFQCSICHDMDVVGILQLPCGHKYHETCAKTWFSVNPQCPLRCSSK